MLLFVYHSNVSNTAEVNLRYCDIVCTGVIGIENWGVGATGAKAPPVCKQGAVPHQK